MQLFEILMLIVIVLLILQYFSPKMQKRIFDVNLSFFIDLINIAFLVLHILFEGARWQLIPLYLTVFALFIAGFYQEFTYRKASLPREGPKSSKTPSRISRAVILLIIMIVISSTLFLDQLFPMFDIPNPSGSYNVGTVIFDLTDSSRDEVFTANPDDNRRILIQVWYPTDDVSMDTKAPYISDMEAFGTGIQQSFRFPPLLVSHLNNIKTNSYTGVEVSENQAEYPVLLFSHGYGGLIMQNTILMEELASHGYIVFSICHPYESAVASFPDGTDIFEGEAPEGHFINDSLTIWANDSTYLLDQLEVTENTVIPGVLWGKMDLDRIGALGHSFGGTTAEELCLTDARVIIGISFDSPHIGASRELNMTKPFMLFFGPDYGNPGLNDIVYNNAQNTCYGLYVNDTRHYNFADVDLWSPILQSFGLIGKINPYRMMNIMNTYIIEFLDQEMKGEDSALLDEQSTDYPEVMFYWNGI